MQTDQISRICMDRYRPVMILCVLGSKGFYNFPGILSKNRAVSGWRFMLMLFVEYPSYLQTRMNKGYNKLIVI